MGKTIIKYSTLYRQITLLIICIALYPILFFIFKCFIVSGTLGFMSSKRVLSVFNGFFSTFILIIIFYLMKLNQSCLVMDETSLSIKKCFNMSVFCWDEILEFGKFCRYSYLKGGVSWFYYIKTISSREQKIIVAKINLLSGDLSFNNIDQLCSAIFEKAHRARFVILRNISWIPFFEKYEEVNWYRDKESKESKFFMSTYWKKF